MAFRALDSNGTELKQVVHTRLTSCWSRSSWPRGCGALNSRPHSRIFASVSVVSSPRSCLLTSARSEYLFALHQRVRHNLRGARQFVPLKKSGGGRGDRAGCIVSNVKVANEPSWALALVAKYQQQVSYVKPWNKKYVLCLLCTKYKVKFATCAPIMHIILPQLYTTRGFSRHAFPAHFIGFLF